MKRSVKPILGFPVKEDYTVFDLPMFVGDSSVFSNLKNYYIWFLSITVCVKDIKEKSRLTQKFIDDLCDAFSSDIATAMFWRSYNSSGTIHAHGFLFLNRPKIDINAFRENFDQICETVVKFWHFPFGDGETQDDLIVKFLRCVFW